MSKKHIAVSIHPKSPIAIRVNALRARHDIGWAVAFDRLGAELIEEYKQQQLDLAARDKRIEDLQEELKRTKEDLAIETRRRVNLDESFEGAEVKVAEQQAEIRLLKGDLARVGVAPRGERLGKIAEQRELLRTQQLKIDELAVNNAALERTAGELSAELSKLKGDLARKLGSAESSLLKRLQSREQFHAKEVADLREELERAQETIAEIESHKASLSKHKGEAVKIGRGFRRRAFRAENTVREISAENAQLRAILAQIAPDLSGVEQEEKYALLFAQIVRLLKP